MLSATSEYALQAMVSLARHAGGSATPSRRIARETRIPQKYLSKILADLVRAGLLEGSRGRGGGFRMVRPAHQIRLAEVVAPFEPISSRARCPLGHMACTDLDPCGAHDRWKLVGEAYDRFLQETSVHDVVTRERELCTPARRGASKKR